jgi:hypothetical protein
MTWPDQTTRRQEGLKGEGQGLWRFSREHGRSRPVLRVPPVRNKPDANRLFPRAFPGSSLRLCDACESLRQLPSDGVNVSPQRITQAGRPKMRHIVQPSILFLQLFRRKPKDGARHWMNGARIYRHEIVAIVSSTIWVWGAISRFVSCVGSEARVCGVKIFGASQKCFERTGTLNPYL